MELTLQFRNETKTCYRFECRDASGNLTTLYLKKADIHDANIDPTKGIHIRIEEAEN